MVKHQNIEDESSFLLPKCNMPNNEKTKQVSSTRNVRHMFVHSPSIPTQTKISPFLASYKRRSKARQSIAKYRRTKQGGGNHYHSWKGRISVRMDVQEFDLKLLVSHLSSKSDFNDNGTGVWRITEFNDAIRLWSSPPSPPSTLPTSLIDNSTIELGCIMEQQSATTVPKSIHSDEEEQLPSIEKHMFEQPQQLQEEEEASTPEVYIFSFGAVVFWNFINEESEQSWMDQFLFDDHGDDSNDEDDGAVGERNHIDAIESANDEMSFGYGTKFYINHDMVQLQTKDCKEKLAVSFALAKSANVSIFEWRLNQAVERNSHIPEELATHGRINMSKKDLKKELGRIYLVKSGINLENDILDTPAEFWEELSPMNHSKQLNGALQSTTSNDKFESEYSTAMEYFDITSRLELVNDRLGVLDDMNTMLIEEAQNSHASRLEWAVILLIVVEIIVELIRAYHDLG